MELEALMVRVGSICVVGLVCGMALGQGEVPFVVGNGLFDPGLGLVDAYTNLIEADDFDGDGFTDLLYAYGTAPHIWIARGLGGQEYEVLGPFLNAATPAMAVGDIDGDGSLEVVTRRGSASDEVVVLRVSDGSLEDEHAAGLAYREPPFGLHIVFRPYVREADLDGDGASEFVMNTTNGKLFVRWSSRDQADPYEEIVVVGLGEDNVLYEPADYDGDGDTDLLLFDEASRKFILVEGSGGDTGWSVRVIEPAYPRVAFGQAPVFGALDTDPALDLVVVSSQTGVAAIIPNFATSPGAAVDLSVHGAVEPLAVIEDLELQDSPTLILADGDEHVLITDPLGDEPVTTHTTLGESETEVISGFYIVGSVDPLRAFDADLDGDLDLLWLGGVGIGGAKLTENRTGATGVPFMGSTAREIPLGVTHVLPGDLNGDGIDELIISGNMGTRILDIAAGSEQRLLGARAPWNTCLADLDGDGREELVQGNTITSELLIYPIDADGNAGKRITYANPDGNGYYSVLSADFDGDGRDDVAALDIVTDIVHILRGVPGPGVEPMGLISDNLSSQFFLPVAIDFDGDGAMDIAIGRRNEDTIEFYRNDGAAGFSLSHTIPADNPYWVTAADIDLDGVTDLVTSNYQDAIEIQFLDGEGQARETVELLHSAPTTEIVVADLNNDGLPDIAASNIVQILRTDPSYVWTQEDDGSFVMAAALPANDATGIAVSDLNADGRVDLVTVSSQPRSLRIHWGTPLACAADLNGDGAVNFFDISAFLQDRPDWNGDGVFNFFDVSDYLQAFLAGCP
ncbi:MAG: VCBS repeat-containing protein [Phycisphaerales bacterium]